MTSTPCCSTSGSRGTLRTDRRACIGGRADDHRSGAPGVPLLGRSLAVRFATLVRCARLGGARRTGARAAAHRRRAPSRGTGRHAPPPRRRRDDSDGPSVSALPRGDRHVRARCRRVHGRTAATDAHLCRGVRRDAGFAGRAGFVQHVGALTACPLMRRRATSAAPRRPPVVGRPGRRCGRGRRGTRGWFGAPGGGRRRPSDGRSAASARSTPPGPAAARARARRRVRLAGCAVRALHRREDPPTFDTSFAGEQRNTTVPSSSSANPSRTNASSSSGCQPTNAPLSGVVIDHLGPAREPRVSCPAPKTAIASAWNGAMSAWTSRSAGSSGCSWARSRHSVERLGSFGRRQQQVGRPGAVTDGVRVA